MLGAVSCVKEQLVPEDWHIGDGESSVSFNMAFKSLADTELGRTRSVGGDEIKTIENVFIVWYNADSTYAGSMYFPQPAVVDIPRDATEQITGHTELKCTMPYGRYRIYAVANMGDLKDDGRIMEESMFRSLQLSWNEENVTENNQMSGYFCESESSEYARGNAPLLTVSRPDMKLHSWIRRAVSKVTVAFDASALNERIYIYIKSAQIMDIPEHCTLVDDNHPSDTLDLIHYGDIIQFGAGDDYENWPRLACGRGANQYGDHSNDAQSLFFFENMQGKHPDKHVYNNFKKKDNVLCGTYVEVKGYYVNNSAENPSYGNIVYRCMLGQDMKEDFNAERNAHYRLTLKFNKDANDPDWHIEYDYVPQPPEIVIPNPMYISYLSNQSVNVPVTIYYDKNLTSVESVTATVIKNDWGYYDHKYVDTNKELVKGFLSMKEDDYTPVTVNDATWRSNGGGSRKFSSAALSYADGTDGEADTCRINIPVYTRPMDLGNGFSGNNYYVGRRRYAKVEIIAKFTGGVGELRDTVDVIQIRRLVNPKGIWRDGNSTKSFRVTLKNTDSIPTVAEVFKDVKSEGGPWTARILEGDWFEIKDTESDTWIKGKDTLTGGTGSVVEFDYRPTSTYKDGCRFGLIGITFHNNTCQHVILVSQGIGLVEIGGRKWHMTNVEYNGKDAGNPLLEGSMFKFGWPSVAFMSSNNLKDGYGFLEQALYKEFDVLDSSGKAGKAVFNAVRADVENGFNNDEIMTDNGKSRVADYDDWNALTDANKFVRYYGVLYGEECDGTLSTNKVTNTYTEPGEEKGMRGCFIYEKSSGRHLFFPIGNTGHGRRQHLDHSPSTETVYRYGVLKYADRTNEMPADVAASLPCLYSLWNEPGAVYWYGEQHKTSPYHYGFDINYMTFGFQSYTSGHVYGVGESAYSDACFIRRVDN
ncbi:MAG: DUF4906 domain-containing protein [Bacteroidales bacterium]|nr:DUF4906 domain-containing protein [Bacteroidales bacterium]